MIINPYLYAGAGGINPTFANVKLLVHFDGANNSTSFVDSSSVGRTVSAAGGGKLTTTTPKFGTASFLGNNATTARATCANHADFDFSGGTDFTIEAWCWRNAAAAGTAGYILAKEAFTSNYPFKLRVESTNFLTAEGEEAGGGIYSISDGTAFPTDQWVHVALCKNGNNYRLFRDGVQVGSTVTNANPVGTNTAIVTIGSRDTSSGGWTGKIDEVRVAREGIYTSNFTPPVAAFPNS